MCARSLRLSERRWNSYSREPTTMSGSCDSDWSAMSRPTYSSGAEVFGFVLLFFFALGSEVLV
jgi:hypothetical protein